MPKLNTLGKLPVRTDKRNFKLKTLLKPVLLPSIPDAYEIDSNLSVSLTIPMFGNDAWGDCVIAGRAHWTLRAEAFEQKKAVPITTTDVLNQYWMEGADGTYHPDNGLVMLDSLNAWRNMGWVAGGQYYNIYAFAAIDMADHMELKYAVYLLSGGYIGFLVPESCLDQFDAGKTWTVVEGSPIVGGHCVYIVGYSKTGPICVTWGKKQQMTWEFFDKYTDEAYAVVDNRNAFTADSPVDTTLLIDYLQKLKGASSATVNVTITAPDSSITNSTASVDQYGKFEIIFTANMKGQYKIFAERGTDKTTLLINVK